MKIICGVDEAGRGPLAGAVFAAAVILDPAHPIAGLADSKKLSEKKRDALAVQIKAHALAWCIAQASVEEIDSINILRASLLAMKRAVEGLKMAPDEVLVDGLYCPDVTFPAPATSPTPTGTTTFDIFSAINFITPLPTAGTAADAISKLVQESIIASLIPTTDTLSLSYLPAHQSSYYTVNSNLSSPGGTTGPWYDLYSKTLHSIGSIYTYGFDEPLWPQVLIGSPFTNGVTYVGITIGSVQ